MHAEHAKSAYSGNSRSSAGAPAPSDHRLHSGFGGCAGWVRHRGSHELLRHGGTAGRDRAVGRAHHGPDHGADPTPDLEPGQHSHPDPDSDAGSGADAG